MGSKKREIERLKDGTLLTPELERELAEEAEGDFDPSLAIPVEVGRPSLSGAGTSPRASFRLTPELADALVRKASEEGKSVSEVAREAIARYVGA